MMEMPLNYIYLLQGSGRDAEDYNLLFHAIKTKSKSCLELVLAKMLEIQGPDSFKWSNEKGTILPNSTAFYCSSPRYNSSAHGSEGEKYRLGSIFVGGKC